jgi:hypothetical protein
MGPIGQLPRDGLSNPPVPYRTKGIRCLLGLRRHLKFWLFDLSVLRKIVQIKLEKLEVHSAPAQEFLRFGIPYGNMDASFSLTPRSYEEQPQ